MKSPLRLVAVLALTACEITPSFVGVGDIQEAMAVERYKTVCVGLDMKEDDTRAFAAEQLSTVKDPLSQECICSHLPDKNKGWDSAVASGIKTTKRDDLATCFADLVRKPDLPNRVDAVRIMTSMTAPVARSVLAEIAEASGDAESRIVALKAIGGDKAYQELLVKLATTESDATVRAAAVDGLGGFKDKETVAVMRKAALEDPEGDVRGAALAAIKRSGVADASDMMCEAMMKDPSPAVRSQAIGAFKGTKRAAAVACLRNRALTLEEDAGVREKLLEVLKSSPHDDAAKVLCDAIPFWAKSYLKEGMPDKVPGTDIIAVQNTRDFERSYACVSAAVRQSSGYSCFAKAYTGFWMRELGGNASVPRCPGYE